jgi:hypothetical protein
MDNIKFLVLHRIDVCISFFIPFRCIGLDSCIDNHRGSDD